MYFVQVDPFRRIGRVKGCSGSKFPIASFARQGYLDSFMIASNHFTNARALLLVSLPEG